MSRVSQLVHTDISGAVILDTNVSRLPAGRHGQLGSCYIGHQCLASPSWSTRTARELLYWTPISRVSELVDTDSSGAVILDTNVSRLPAGPHGQLGSCYIGHQCLASPSWSIRTARELLYWTPMPRVSQLVDAVSSGAVMSRVSELFDTVSSGAVMSRISELLCLASLSCSTRSARELLCLASLSFSTRSARELMSRFSKLFDTVSSRAVMSRVSELFDTVSSGAVMSRVSKLFDTVSSGAVTSRVSKVFDTVSSGSCYIESVTLIVNK